jgi:protein-S-isoprenylcysteine O-methyltransferase Ste14
MQRYVQLAGREYTFNQRMIATLCAGILFVLLIPTALCKLGPRLDYLFHLPKISFGKANTLLGCIFIAAGVIYAWWSGFLQIDRARGTPLPVMPTHTLLVSGPFMQSRNPMTFGTILLYVGIGISIGSISAIGLVLIFGGLLLTYIKLVEERELELRFGQEYVEYKGRTPFFFPRFLPRRRDRRLAEIK